MELRRGLGYLSQGSSRDAILLIRQLAEARTACLWITAEPHGAVPPGVEVVRVATLGGRPGTLDPKRLPTLRSGASAFLDMHGGGAIIVDCVGALAAYAGVERVLRALEDLHEEVATRQAILAVFLDPRTASPRLVAWLERELDALPGTVATGEVADRLAA